mgnify:CR=1 FL=1
MDINTIKHFQTQNLINHYISFLQVAGYKVSLNNYAIGDYHNIRITKYVCVKLLWWNLYKIVDVYDDQIRLPLHLNILIKKFVDILRRTNVAWERYPKYFDMDTEAAE